MRFEVLGPLRVTREDDVVPLSGRVRLGLLGLLLAHANTPVPPEMLLDALWGEADAPDPQRLHLTVHRLRRALGEPGRLVLDPGGYVLRVAPGELDAQLFDDAVAQAERTEDPCRRASLLRGALARWRGDAYQGLDLCPLVGDAERLTERRDAACELLYAAEIACGRHGTAVADLSALVRRHPLREHLHALLMTALWRSGRQADALAVYRGVRRTLVDELGVEPGPELRDLERRILSGGDDAGGDDLMAPATLAAR